MPVDDKTRKEFEKWGVPLPTSEPHGTDEDIRQNMVQFLPKKWRLEGNQLIGETEMGNVAQYIPTNYILTGTDAKGLPILTKVKT